MTLWCQKWPLDRGSEAAPANLMQTPLNDAAFQETFHRLLDMKNNLHISDRILITQALIKLACQALVKPV